MKIAILVGFVAMGAACTFNAHPPNGTQACSTDTPPRCLDGYTCVSGLCYLNDQAPGSGGNTGVGVGGTTGAGTGGAMGKDASTVVACGQATQPCCADESCATGFACAESTASTGKLCLPTCVSSVGACTQGSSVDCALQCGIAKLGNKTCSCTSGNWKCGSCTYPFGDYACFKVPATLTACDSVAPTVGTACTYASCTVCGATSAKAFVDIDGVSRSGYCVCANGRWACSIPRDWPCPGNSGC
jgi:hypothetical protein